MMLKALFSTNTLISLKKGYILIKKTLAIMTLMWQNRNSWAIKNYFQICHRITRSWDILFQNWLFDLKNSVVVFQLLASKNSLKNREKYDSKVLKNRKMLKFYDFRKVHLYNECMPLLKYFLEEHQNFIYEKIAHQKQLKTFFRIKSSFLVL